MVVVDDSGFKGREVDMVMGWGSGFCFNNRE